MAFFSAWLTVFAVSLVAVVTPGPDFALTLRNSLAYSRRAGIFTAIGVGAGNLVHATYSLIGVGAVISQSILLFNVLKWIGAAYLIYIGIKSLNAKKIAIASDFVEQQRDIGRWTAFHIGFLGNLLNPKATLFFLALFTQIVQPTTPLVAQAVYGATVAAVALVWFAVVAIVISQQIFKRHILAIAHWLERLTGVALIALGVRLAVAEANE
ncbi:MULTISPECIES: LysE family transporter [Cyanophyceae]|uniref:LysE family transporter n=1 Tax=Cyanophyceae TaxID=3028117 RepID=UPI00168760B7|nr:MULTISPECIES: LysE family transporter [Cyanophyceae]MBD1915854.1 LysE family transporter [Phormidium sp. FACHB-77]MBD2030472.1 LysE family transporter [Phormidium sp. FACHB-322]MBD2053474.1 LysE family transporter [Leptolyngbya sp. FACHB-60]